MLELIKKIEKRPSLYLGCHSINYLRVFLNGFLYAMPKDESIEFYKDFEGFQAYTQKKYQVTTTQGWHQIILFYSANEADALDKFFEIFNDFLKTS